MTWLLAENVDLSSERLHVRLSYVKGRRVRDLVPATYHRVTSTLHSPLDVVRAWDRQRPPHSRYFGLPTDPANGLDSAMVTRFLRAAVLRVGGEEA